MDGSPIMRNYFHFDLILLEKIDAKAVQEQKVVISFIHQYQFFLCIYFTSIKKITHIFILQIIV